MSGTTFEDLEKRALALLQGGNLTAEPQVYRAAIYARQSRFEPGANNSPSTKAQIANVREFLQRRFPSVEIVSELQDINRTGRNSRRSEFQQLVSIMKKGEINLAAFWSLDRLFRNLESIVDFFRLAERSGVRVVTVAEGIDSSRPAMKIFQAVFSVLAEIEVRRTSEDIRNAKYLRFLQGLPNGRLPFGYCLGNCSTCTDPNGKGYCPRWHQGEDLGDGRVPVPHPFDKYAVQMLFMLYDDPASVTGLDIEGELSDRDLANLLNKYDFRLPTGERVHFRPRTYKERKVFTASNVRTILNNVLYVGLVKRLPRPPLQMDDDLLHPERVKPRYPKHAKKPVEIKRAQHEPLIPFSLFERVQHKRRAKGRATTHAGSNRKVYLLSGIARCAVCYNYGYRQSGLRGSSRGKKGGRYYRCGLLMERHKRRKNEEEIVQLLRATALSPVATSESEIFEQWAAAHHNIPAEKAEQQVEALIRSAPPWPQEWREDLARYLLDESAGLAEWLAQQRQIQQELTALKEALAHGLMSHHRYEDQREILEIRLRQLDLLEHPKFRQIEPYLDNIGKLWDLMNIYQRKRFLQILFHALYFDAEGRLVRVEINPPFDRWLRVPEHLTA